MVKGFKLFKLYLLSYSSFAKSAVIVIAKKAQINVIILQFILYYKD